MEGGRNQNRDCDTENPIAPEEVVLQNNDIALSAIHDAVNEKTF